MIREVEGDILLSKAQAIAHGVAPGDHFSTGLALSLRERWPAMVQDFRHYCHANHPKSGTLWSWGGAGGVRIVNLFTQEAAHDHGSKPGKAHLEHVNHSLRELKKIIEKEGWTSIALPKIATGVGTLKWEDVKPLIDKHLGQLTSTTVFVYTTYKAGKAANEA